MIGLTSLSKKVDKLDAQLGMLITKPDRPSISPAQFKDALDKLASKISDAEDTLKELKQSEGSEMPEIDAKLEALRRNIMQVVSNISSSTSGGGNANRNIQVGGVNVLRPFTDINFIAGANTTITTAANQTTKYTDITITATGGGGSGITIGTTTITSGTDTRILYDNAGVVGEYTLTGTGTVVVMQTSPSLITPALGVATATSLAIGGATIGSNGLAITGHVLVEGVTSTGATGTGKFVFDGTPTLVTPVLGVATATSLAIGGATIGSNGLAVTGHLLLEGVTSTGATGTGLLVFGTSPTLTTAVLGSSTATTQAAGTSNTTLATTAFVASAVLGQNFKEAAKYASTAALPASVYNNGASGVGATLTEVGLGAIVLDGQTPIVGDRVLIKNQVSTFQNGIYTVTTVGSAGVAFVLTRSLDANQSFEFETGDSLFVTAGTTQSATTWAYTGIDSPVMGTDAITYVQTAGQGSFTSGNGITITGNSIAIDTSVTLDKTTAQTGISNKTFVAPVLGAATATSINGLVITTTTGTFTLTNAKTLTVSDSTTFATNAITLGGGEVITFSASNALSLLTTGTSVMTFPTATDTVAVLGTAQTYTATQTEKQVVWTNNAITASGNAATVPITSRLNTVTNNSAATLTITMTTTSAVDGQLSMVRVLDFSGVAQTITWVNTEDSTATAPTTSNGSTTLPKTIGFQFNGGTSKWRTIASA